MLLSDLITFDLYANFFRRAPSIYINIFSGEATIQFPTATQMARGGVCFLITLKLHSSGMECLCLLI